MAHILTVDDDKIVLGFLKTALELRGHSVSGVTSADDALQHLAKERVDLVLTDVQMPGKSGLELISAIGELPSPPPVVAMSGGGYALTAHQCVSVAVQMGAVGSITKPFSLSALFQAVDQGLTHHGRSSPPAQPD